MMIEPFGEECYEVAFLDELNRWLDEVRVS
jgi:hypothetical protein